MDQSAGFPSAQSPWASNSREGIFTGHSCFPLVSGTDHISAKTFYLSDKIINLNQGHPSSAKPKGAAVGTKIDFPVNLKGFVCSHSSFGEKRIDIMNQMF